MPTASPVDVSAGYSLGILIPGLLIFAAAIVAILRNVDVRLALLSAALLLGVLAGHLGDVTKVFLSTLVAEKFIVPICTAMAFAHVLRYTGCDQHLVHLLVRPLRRVRPLFLPGAVLIGYVVNIPVISQTSTAVAIGSVLVPLLMAAGLAPATVGAALLLGSSVGGELLNPGAPELETISSITKQPTTEIVAQILPLGLVQLGVAVAVFWGISLLLESRRKAAQKELAPCDEGVAAVPFKVSILKAMVPVLPLVLLFMVGPPLQIVKVPREWLVTPGYAKYYDSRLVGVAMLLGTLVAAVIGRASITGAVTAWSRGVLYAYWHIITLIVAANTFGKGIELIGLAAVIGGVITSLPGLMLPAAGFLPLSFAVLCGSGMASTQSLFKFFAEPALSLGVDPTRVGALVSLGSAAGRTMSPVAAVALMCGVLTGTNAVTLVRRVAIPLLLGVLAAVIFAGISGGFR